jgi:serine/threonine protein kinase
MQLFESECKILSKIKNENVMSMFQKFENKNCYFLVLEHCNEGDLNDYLKSKKNKNIPEEEAV